MSMSKSSLLLQQLNLWRFIGSQVNDAKAILGNGLTKGESGLADGGTSTNARKRNRAPTSQIKGNKQDHVSDTIAGDRRRNRHQKIVEMQVSTPSSRAPNPEQSSNIVNAKSNFICFLWLTNFVVASFFLSTKTKLLKANRLVFFESIGVIETLSSPQISVTVAAMATTKLYVVYYSLYRHVEIMAREVQRGANSVQGVEATIWQVPETLSDIILQKMKAPAKAGDVPEIRPEQLLDADGFLFGFPSRFGVMAAQFKAFFDATSELWKGQALAGKPAGIFWSTGFHGGGQELTALTAITQLAHHGMIFVPLGYTFGSGMFEMDEVKGGSAYGAGTYAADGSREPTELELQQAFHQGKYVAEITKKLKNEPLSP
ncbi:hypothetical protein GQ457_12G028090 [Hibiscus cannabinus]